jgi:hypothetical protein
MVFDDYRVTAAPATAPHLEFLEGARTARQSSRSKGSPGQQFALEASDDLATWATLTTETIPVSGQLTYEDAGAAGPAGRFYRSRCDPVMSFAQVTANLGRSGSRHFRLEPARGSRVVVDGKFFRRGAEKFWLRG